MGRSSASVRRGAHRPVSWERGAAYAALSAAVFLVLLEAVLRLAGFSFAPGPIRVQMSGEQFARALRDAAWQRSLPAYQPEGRYEDSASLIWKPIAGVPPFNGQGLLGPVLPRERSDRLRIACLGDSCTQLGTPRYPDVLRGMLAEHYGKGVEVLNAGVIGYSTYQGLVRLKQDVLPYRPDIVTIYFGWNDHGSIYTARDPQLARDRRHKAFAWVNYVGWSRVVQAVLWSVVEWRRASGAEAQPAERHVLRVPLEDYRRNLGELIALCRSHGAVPVLVTAPTTMVHGPTPPGLESAMAGEAGRLYGSLPAMHEAYVRATREVARETGTALVDANAAFGDGRGLIERDYVHLQPEGARRMGKLISEEVAAIVAADPVLARRAGVRPTVGPRERQESGVGLPAAGHEQIK